MSSDNGCDNCKIDGVCQSKERCQRPIWLASIIVAAIILLIVTAVLLRYLCRQKKVKEDLKELVKYKKMIKKAGAKNKSTPRNLHSQFNSQSIENEVHHSTILNRTHNELMLTGKGKERPRDIPTIFEDNEQINIGQTYENRNTILCFENQGELNTIQTSKMYNSDILFTNPKFGHPRIKPWAKHPTKKGVKILNEDLKIFEKESREESKHRSDQTLSELHHSNEDYNHMCMINVDRSNNIFERRESLHSDLEENKSRI
ncbi:unnamed protein product [Moneuplotes crassus]|uniref:Uncharacterized protein n=1 Tax=Euplotes crassus TaxID=5936 RepID=A0AAD1XBJ5_EUPCR|nr:unnamed protein product [Moneuplotes crassus]